MIPHLARLALAVVLVLPVPALGEIVTLTHGRTMEGQTIAVTAQREQRGLRYLLGSLPEEWQERWSDIVSDQPVTGLIVLLVVTLLCIVMIPALMLHAGSTIVGVTDPTYSRALLCVFLLYAYTFAFVWVTNRIGWLVTLELVELGLLHFALLLPLYLAGQSLIYKWAYVTDWGKAIPLVFVGLLVGVITCAGALVLMNIFA